MSKEPIIVEISKPHDVVVKVKVRDQTSNQNLNYDKDSDGWGPSFPDWCEWK
jgi:hypothetical protein